MEGLIPSELQSDGLEFIDFMGLEGMWMPDVNLPLTISRYKSVNITRMSNEALQIDDQSGSNAGCRVLRLTGPLVLTTMFGFQTLVRADASQSLIIDFSDCP